MAGLIGDFVAVFLGGWILLIPAAVAVDARLRGRRRRLALWALAAVACLVTGLFGFAVLVATGVEAAFPAVAFGALAGWLLGRRHWALRGTAGRAVG